MSSSPKATAQAQATAAARASQTQDISDDELFPQDDDNQPTTEEVSEHEMEARKNNLKEGETVHKKRITKQAKRKISAKKEKHDKQTTS